METKTWSHVYIPSLSIEEAFGFPDWFQPLQTSEKHRMTALCSLGLWDTQKVHRKNFTLDISTRGRVEGWGCWVSFFSYNPSTSWLYMWFHRWTSWEEGASSRFAVSCCLSHIISQLEKFKFLVALEALLRHISFGWPGGGTPSKGQRLMAKSKRKSVAQMDTLPFISIYAASSLYV